MKKTLNDRIEFRINAEDKAAFIKEAVKTTIPYQMLLREFIVAFNKDRLRISGKKIKGVFNDN
jgi:predicted DNA binding CopG/RHH family protein